MLFILVHLAAFSSTFKFVTEAGCAQYIILSYRVLLFGVTKLCSIYLMALPVGNGDVMTIAVARFTIRDV